MYNLINEKHKTRSIKEGATTMKFDIYQTITDRIINQLEKGLIPWEKTWSGVSGGAFNRISRKPYSLLNQMLLSKSGEYATFKQWQNLGGHIRKGAKAEMVVYWNIIEKEEIDKDGEKVVVGIPILKYYNVFHISDVEGVAPLTNNETEVKPIDSAEQLIIDYVTREHINYKEVVSDKAYYSPTTDSVVVPTKKQYQNVNDFYATAFHEITHSTGNKSRLNRITSVAAFGSQEYSKEELVAEIGSATLMKLLNLETSKTFRNTTAYIQSWLRVLKNDKRFIVSAASKAEKAVNFILGNQ